MIPFADFTIYPRILGFEEHQIGLDGNQRFVDGINTHCDRKRDDVLWICHPLSVADCACRDDQILQPLKDSLHEIQTLRLQYGAFARPFTILTWMEHNARQSTIANLDQEIQRRNQRRRIKEKYRALMQRRTMERELQELRRQSMIANAEKDFRGNRRIKPHEQTDRRDRDVPGERSS